jgi:hypothetical protein
MAALTRRKVTDKRKNNKPPKNGSPGRPKGTPNLIPLDAKQRFGALARTYSEEALETLVGIMRAEEGGDFEACKDDYRLRADMASLIIAYGVGKPAQSHEVHGMMQALVGIKVDWDKFDALPVEKKKLIVSVIENVAAGIGRPSPEVPGTRQIEHRPHRASDV